MSYKRLSKNEVVKILNDKNRSPKELSQYFGVTVKTINKILKGESWNNIDRSRCEK